MKTDIRVPRLPKTIFKMVYTYGAWIVGGACLEETPKDLDVMVPWSEWHQASLLIPEGAKPNIFGGWKWTEDGVSVDCWPDSLDRLATAAPFQAALHPKSGRMLVPASANVPSKP